LPEQKRQREEAGLRGRTEIVKRERERQIYKKKRPSNLQEDKARKV